MKTDIQIAQEAKMMPIKDVAAVRLTILLAIRMQDRSLSYCARWSNASFARVLPSSALLLRRTLFTEE